MKKIILMSFVALGLGIVTYSYSQSDQVIGTEPHGIIETAQIIGTEPHSPVVTI